MPEQYNIKLIPKKNERKRWLNLWCFDIIIEWILSEHDFEIKSKYQFQPKFRFVIDSYLEFSSWYYFSEYFLKLSASQGFYA